MLYFQVHEGSSAKGLILGRLVFDGSKLGPVFSQRSNSVFVLCKLESTNVLVSLLASSCKCTKFLVSNNKKAYPNGFILTINRCLQKHV